jgi:diguanylate cyclase (GGDEF)-like protein
MALAVIVYSVVIIKTVIPVNKSIVRAMRLNYTLENEIETRKIVEEKLHKLSNEDALTGVYNRRYFDTKLGDEINRAKRSNSPLCLALIDIDYFKQYNDFYGHQQGDKCLQAVVKVLQQSLQRSGDILARYGGEEFAIILPNMNQLEAKSLTHKMQHALELANLEHQKSSVKNVSYITISAGIAKYSSQSENTPEILIEHADNALYAAKSAGRNQVSCFGDS